MEYRLFNDGTPLFALVAISAVHGMGEQGIREPLIMKS